MQVTVRNIALFVICVYEIILCYQFLFSTVLYKDEIRKREKIIIVINTLLCGFLLMVNRNIVFFSRLMFILEASMICTSLLFVKSKNRILKIIIAVTYQTILALMDFGIAFLCMESMGESFYDKVFSYSNYWWPVLIFASTRLLATGMYLYIRRTKYDIKEYKSILSVVLVAALFFVRYYQEHMSAMLQGLRPLQGMHMGGSVFVVIFIIATMALLGMKNRIIAKENELLSLRDDMLLNKYVDIEKEIEQNRILIHDIKHDYLILKEHAKQEDIDGIKNYLEALGDGLKTVNGEIWTNNSICDLVLRQKKTEAESKGIEVNISSMIIPVFPIDDRDTCSVLGNLLDNAIEACEKVNNKDKVIDIKIEKNNHLLFVEVSNTLNEQININDMKTTKKDKCMHGYGLKSVKRIVEKNEGAMAYHIKDDKFTVRLSFFDIELN